jgi:hypothetical protein
MELLLAYVRSAEVVWLLWLGAVLALLGLTRAALTGFGRAGWHQLLLDEEGAAYSISFVLTIPIYTMLIFIVVETTLFLIVKIGTVHAAYAAVRSHIVYSSLDRTQDKSLTKQKREQAAINVMAAFASSNWKHAVVLGIKQPPPPAAALNAVKYYAAYRVYDYDNDHPGTFKYITKKYIYAHIATKVTIKEKSNDWNADVKAIVEYEMPFQLSFIGRILGKRVLPFINVYTVTVRSEAILPNDAPRNDTRSLGIDYVPRD